MSNDIVYTYRGSWCAEGCNTSWNSSWRIIGERGTVLWDGENGFACQVVEGNTGFARPTRPVEVPRECPAELTQGHNSIIQEFLDAVAGKRAPETVCTDNIKSLAMVHGAVKSAETGRRVRLAPARRAVAPTREGA
jgi:predicted dehydrogenase